MARTDLITTIGDASAANIIQYLPAYAQFYPLLTFVAPYVITDTDVAVVCRELDAIIQALPSDPTVHNHVLLAFTSNVLVPFFTGKYRASGNNIATAYPNIFFYISNNSMADDNGNTQTIMLQNPNAYRMADVISGTSVSSIADGLTKVWGARVVPTVWYVYQQGDNAAQSALKQFQDAVLLLGWPAGVEYPVVYQNNSFDLTAVRQAIQNVSQGPILILIATNSSTASAFTTSALQTGPNGLQAFFNALQAANIRYANMNYSPNQPIPVDFYFVRSYPSGSYSKLDKIVMPSYKRLTQSRYSLSIFAEGLAFIAANASERQVAFVGTRDNRFYLDDSNSRVMGFMERVSTIPANTDPRDPTIPVTKFSNTDNPYST